MDKIKLKCPSCGSVLAVPDNPDYAGKMLTCPVCHTKNLFDKYSRVCELSSETCIGTNSSESASFYLLDKSSKVKYPLREGNNLVGRLTLSSPSKADIPIKTDDKGFSRAHCVIKVIRAVDGSLRCYITNAENKNATYINSKPLSGTDVIAIYDDDEISSSQTTLVLKKFMLR